MFFDRDGQALPRWLSSSTVKKSYLPLSEYLPLEMAI
jgi:hypothetical protein